MIARLPPQVVSTTPLSIGKDKQFVAGAEFVYASRSDPDFGWATAQQIDVDQSPPDSVGVCHPGIGFDGAGNAIAAWQHFDFATQPGVYAVRAGWYTPTGGWGGVSRVGSAGGRAAGRGIRDLGPADRRGRRRHRGGAIRVTGTALSARVAGLLSCAPPNGGG